MDRPAVDPGPCNASSSDMIASWLRDSPLSKPTPKSRDLHDFTQRRPRRVEIEPMTPIDGIPQYSKRSTHAQPGTIASTTFAERDLGDRTTLRWLGVVGTCFTLATMLIACSAAPSRRAPA